MTHSLQISDNLTTVDLTLNTTALLLDYEPQAPSITQQEAVSAILDGGELTSATFRNVTESARVVIVGANGAAVQTTIRNIDRLFRQAEERQKRRGSVPRVYVQVQMDSDAAEWQSEILSGSLTLSDKVWEEWGNSKAEVILTWTRRFYWEGAQSTLTISNGSGSGTSRTIYNYDGATSGHDNYVIIDGSAVAGSLPAACIISIENTAGTSVGFNNIYIGHGAYFTTASFQTIYEGEDNLTGGGTDTSNANSSGGYYHAKTWGSSSDYTVPLYSYTLTGQQMLYAKGGHVRVLARCHTAPNATTYAKMGLNYGAAIVMETPEVKLKNQQLQNFGVLRLPPTHYDIAVGPGDLTLYVYARDTVAGSLSVDYFMLMPADGWRHLRTIGTSYDDGTTFVDDGINGVAYAYTDADGSYPDLVVRGGNPIMLVPGYTQRLYFLFDEDNGNSVIARTCSVSVAYRPRRLTL